MQVLFQSIKKEDLHLSLSHCKRNKSITSRITALVQLFLHFYRNIATNTKYKLDNLPLYQDNIIFILEDRRKKI